MITKSSFGMESMRARVVAAVLMSALILVAHPSAGLRNLSELIQTAKSKSFSYGTSGTGGTPHLAGELLKQRTGIQLEHIPYKGGGPGMRNRIQPSRPNSTSTAISSERR